MALSPDKQPPPIKKAALEAGHEPHADTQETAVRANQSGPRRRPALTQDAGTGSSSEPEEAYPMPKMKTSKTAAKRFKKTGTGKLRHVQPNHQHQFDEEALHRPTVSTAVVRCIGRREEDQTPARRALRHYPGSARLNESERGASKWHE